MFKIKNNKFFLTMISIFLMVGLMGSNVMASAANAAPELQEVVTQKQETKKQVPSRDKKQAQIKRRTRKQAARARRAVKRVATVQETRDKRQETRDKRQETRG